MARKTIKYLQVCRVLGIQEDADIPPAALYGMLSLRGNSWQGDCWSRDTKETPVYNGSIRVSALSGDSETITLALLDFIAQMGLEATTIKGPYANQKSQNELWHINVIYRR